METITTEKNPQENEILQLQRKNFYNFVNEEMKAEFINGEIVVHSPAKAKHIDVCVYLSKLLSTYVDLNELGKVYVEKAMTKLKENDFEPDICFFRKEISDKFNKNTLLFPPPDFVVEIISKSTEERDRGIKFIDYALNGVAEYWIIDTDTEIVEQYLLFDGKYKLLKKVDEGVVKCNQITGLEIPVRAIFDKNENLKLLKSIL